MCVGSLAGVTYLRYTVLMSSNKSETAVRCCDPALSVLVMLVSQNALHVVSALQSFAFIHFIKVLADQISYRSYVGSIYRMGSFAVSYANEITDDVIYAINYFIKYINSDFSVKFATEIIQTWCTPSAIKKKSCPHGNPSAL